LEFNDQHIFVIAEVGCNHNGSLENARELIRCASRAGADAVKFQTFDPKRLLVQTAPKADYQIRATGAEESQYDRLCRLRLSEADHEMLKAYAEEHQLMFCSTPFDRESAEYLNQLGMPFFKIASGEITNGPLLETVAAFGKPILLSTGMSDLKDVRRALDDIGTENRALVTLLHCLSDYPAKWEDANLRAIQTLRVAFDLPVGFSDHSQGIELPLVAAGLGAVVIEKHITLSREMEGGDHRASLEPNEFIDMVAKLRKLPHALGDGIKRCMPSEENVRRVARKSLVAERFIPQGAIITADDLALKRPGTGLSPESLIKVIGMRARSDIAADTLIEWTQLMPADD